MVMLGLKLVGEIRFSDVVITLLVFDEQGRKMSKSVAMRLIRSSSLVSTFVAAWWHN